MQINIIKLLILGVMKSVNDFSNTNERAKQIIQSCPDILPTGK